MIDDSLPQTRGAVRRLLDSALDHGLLAGGEFAVGVSGGADSLALAAASAYVAQRLDLRVHGLIVDHGLQASSAQIAEDAAATLGKLGIDTVRVLPVSVGTEGGPEAAARRSRYAALRAALPAPDALVLLGHTLDDQAETVLLGLGRGSGPRSISGMSPLDAPWGRPFLGVPRAVTVAACARLGLTPWADPHNVDPRFTRVRLRAEVLPLLENVLNGGVAAALARTAAQLREDAEALDEWAARVLTELSAGGPVEALTELPEEVPVEALVDLPPAIRRRVLRRWLLAGGVREQIGRAHV